MGTECKARTANTGANDPQDCDWPFCGCDDHANKVIEAIEESGLVIIKEQTLKALQSASQKPK